jgi:hypothetical protein
MDETNEKCSGSREVNAISIIITTIKDNIITLRSLEHCPVPYEVIISKKTRAGFCKKLRSKTS